MEEALLKRDVWNENEEALADFPLSSSNSAMFFLSPSTTTLSTEPLSGSVITFSKR